MCHRNSYSVVLAVASSIFTAASCFGSEIRVWSGGAVTPAMNVLVPQFEQQTSHKVQSRIMTVRQLPQKLAAGERGEIVITALPDIDQFIKDGFLRASSRAILGSVGIALVVREGAAKPDISTPEKLRKVLLDARKIVHSRPGDTPSGKFLIEVFQDLGVTRDEAQGRLSQRGGRRDGVDHPRRCRFWPLPCERDDPDQRRRGGGIAAARGAAGDGFRRGDHDG